jgi:hypothetical protein
MSDTIKGTHFMRGEGKWLSILTPNNTFEPTFQASIYNPIKVNTFGEVVDSDSESILAGFENRGFKHSVKTDKETNEKFLFFKRKAIIKRPVPILDSNGKPIFENGKQQFETDEDGKWIMAETDNDIPQLKDKDNNDIDVAIGNGSDVIVMYKEWGTSNQYGEFKGLDLAGLQVVTLQEYNPDVGFSAISMAEVEEF